MNMEQQRQQPERKIFVQLPLAWEGSFPCSRRRDAAEWHTAKVTMIGISSKSIVVGCFWSINGKQDKFSESSPFIFSVWRRVAVHWFTIMIISLVEHVSHRFSRVKSRLVGKSPRDSLDQCFSRKIQRELLNWDSFKSGCRYERMKSLKVETF